MGKAPEVCIYCKGTGESSAGGSCGFCEGGKPLDTQEDWDRTWGKALDDEGVKEMVDEVLRELAGGRP
jgi:hypothetical protein